MNAPSFPALEQTALLIPVMPEEPVLPLSVGGYHALIKAGILQEGAPIELLEGFMVRKMTKGPRHESTRRRLRRLLEQIIAGDYFVDEQGAVTTVDSEPEPDIFVVRGSLSAFNDRHPTPDESVLIVEIADSSLWRDRGLKRRVYARANVACYWLVNLVDESVEVYAQPCGSDDQPTYAQRTVYRANDQIPVLLDGNEVGRIDVAAILGR